MEAMSTRSFSLHADGAEIVDWMSAGPDGYVSASCSLAVRRSTRAAGDATVTELSVTNTGANPSPLLSRIVFFRDERTVSSTSVPVIHHSGGGLTDAVFPSTAWRIQRTELVDWSALKLEGAKGRSANRDLPIFLVTDEEETRGVAYVAGYSGNVVSTILRDQDYTSLSVSMGIRDLSLRIPPGDAVTLGSALALPYEGGRRRGVQRVAPRVARAHLSRGIAQGGLRSLVRHRAAFQRGAAAP